VPSGKAVADMNYLGLYFLEVNREIIGIGDTEWKIVSTKRISEDQAIRNVDTEVYFNAIRHLLNLLKEVCEGFETRFKRHTVAPFCSMVSTLPICILGGRTHCARLLAKPSFALESHLLVPEQELCSR